MATPLRTAAKVFYYARNFARDLAPQALFRRRLAGWLEQTRRSDGSVRERVNYYNRLERPFAPSPAAVPVSRMPFSPSMYYYDLKEFARYFDPALLIDLEFGDVIDVPKMPAIVKDRPITDGNGNAVLMKLDKFRHFQLPADRQPFADKRPLVVWRGDLNNPIRTRFLDAVRDLPICDVGTPKKEAKAEYQKPYLTIDEQRRYRYIVSLEGNDVATNLKWIMSSNSLCLMPPPTYETWFAESEVRADVHYVPLAPDFSDLADRVAYFEKHPAEAERIVAAANAYCQKFRNERDEQAISLLVLYKYFVLSGQVKPDPEVWRFITG
ncbi:lipopolysaccharide biosynthesis protein [Mesorhizobium sp. M4B.F.Ca.ET.215.01.1.1]|uniref:glycosyl transferase family 90 n=2 Tax=Mesorhizobium TaxID=68287 RepID=UPI000FCA2528|nr:MULTISPECIES: glycosyl transferase family 90 [unclassified Mesorhizobium]RUW23167.1 lipopolysaccharide biosynthesis protein [Mesorhizobium sp. M4B.F.Ca.ET.013.02.1.1]RVD38285.1 lipopolysaccharide biosynthesis protein [Mesorhizobium sp. M4B.F.Ca.ET.019.03.1.1]RWA62174.1 MAG: lipopolysaccharide biosynthesis protein [Mesorhizobium sp.]RWF61399.1 MAG: lipopolysaccharide biosynthesis protein [Mesorhizobium sp.]TGQ07358.1 lipopolysaccharide biosynthesis protein [Mesorhizobium sp. M4B.F.Ca.ET.215.